MKARLAFLFILLCGLAGSVTSTWLNQKAMAARNSSGTYSLYTPGNPVITGTTISTAWANNTLTDIGTELTNSLDRNGRGAMLQPLQLASGSTPTPGLAFSAEPSTGLYRNASNDIRFAVAGADVQAWSATGTSVTGTVSTSGTISIIGDTDVDSSGAAAGTTFPALGGDHGLHFGHSSGEGISSKRTAGAGQFGLDLWTASTNRLSVNASGGIQIPGEFATTPGTSITASYGASYTFAFGSLTAGTPVLQSQTLTGVATGGVCEVSVDGNIGANALSCYVSAANTIQIKVVPVASNTLSSGTYRVRVFQP